MPVWAIIIIIGSLFLWLALAGWYRSLARLHRTLTAWNHHNVGWDAALEAREKVVVDRELALRKIESPSTRSDTYPRSGRGEL